MLGRPREPAGVSPARKHISVVCCPGPPFVRLGNYNDSTGMYVLRSARKGTAGLACNRGAHRTRAPRQLRELC